MHFTTNEADNDVLLTMETFKPLLYRQPGNVRSNPAIDCSSLKPLTFTNAMPIRNWAPRLSAPFSVHFFKFDPEYDMLLNFFDEVRTNACLLHLNFTHS